MNKNGRMSRSIEMAGRSFRLFRPGLESQLEDPLMRAIVKHMSGVLRDMAMEKDPDCRRFARWLSRPREFDAFVVEMYAMHVWNLKSRPRKQILAILNSQAPAPAAAKYTGCP